MATRALAREARGGHPDVVAAVVDRAVHAPRQRTRYLAGKDARLLAAVARLPPPVFDRVRRRFSGLPRPGSAERAAPGLGRGVETT